MVASMRAKGVWAMILVLICVLFIFHQLIYDKGPPPYAMMEIDSATEIGSTTPDPSVNYFRHNSNFSLQPAFNLTTSHAFVIYVMSAISKPGERQLIRETWGNLKNIRKFKKHQFSVQLMFVVGGLQYIGLEEQQAVISEHQHHKDILTIDNLQDSYGNLTEKSIYALNYILDEFDLENVDFIFKIDSDTFINMFKYLSLAWDVVDADPPVDLVCSYFPEGGAVIRTRRYREPRSRYAPDTYPRFCSGPAYVVGRRILPRLLSGAFKVPMLRSEDVMLTGVGLQHMEHLNVFEIPFNDIFFENVNFRKAQKRDPDVLQKLYNVFYAHELSRDHWLYAYSHLASYYLPDLNQGNRTHTASMNT